MSSRYEGMPMVLLEAMSYGLPVVSFACPCGPKDVISDGSDGFLCEDGNIKELANAVLILIRNAEQRKAMGREVRMKSLHYSQTRIMELWKDLFVEITSESV